MTKYHTKLQACFLYQGYLDCVYTSPRAGGGELLVPCMVWLPALAAEGWSSREEERAGKRGIKREYEEHREYIYTELQEKFRCIPHKDQ